MELSQDLDSKLLDSEIQDYEIQDSEIQDSEIQDYEIQDYEIQDSEILGIRTYNPEKNNFLDLNEMSSSCSSLSDDELFQTANFGTIKNIVELSSVGTCMCPKCRSQIFHELYELYNVGGETCVYNGYLGHKYIYDGKKMLMECTNPKLCNNNYHCQTYKKYS